MATPPPHIEISSRSGNIRVVAGPGPETAVTARHATVSHRPDGTVLVEPAGGPKEGIELSCPTGSHLVIGTATGQVELRGHLGSVRVVTASGRVEIEHVDGLDVRTASGRVEVGRCEGPCRIVTSSGRVDIARADAAEVTTSSGRIDASVHGRASITTVSGRVSVSAEAPDPIVRVSTVSGTVAVDVPLATRPELSLTSTSGRIRCDCAPGDDGEIAVATTSGSIEVRHR